MSTCSKYPLGDIFDNMGVPITISETKTNDELNAQLKRAYNALENNPRKTESQKFNAAEQAGVIAGLLANKRGNEYPNEKSNKKLKQIGGETEEEKKQRIANENKALLVSTVITFIICDQTFGAGVSKPLTEYLNGSTASLTGKALDLVNQVFEGVIESYAKALPGVRGGCEGALDYSIDIVRRIPYIGNYVSLDNKLPTCAQRMLSYNETVASITKILSEIGIVAGTTALSLGFVGKYHAIWKDETYDTPASKVAAICSAIGGDTISLGENSINALLYIPLASARALSRIVPNATATAWSAATSPYQWFESWGKIENSAQRIAITSGTTSDGNISDGTTSDTSDGAASDTMKEAASGGRRTRRRKSHKKAAKKSRKQKKKRSSTKHKRRGRKTRRGGMGCGNHKKTKRRRG